METEGKLVTNRIHVTLFIGREREGKRGERERIAGSIFPKSTEKKKKSEKSGVGHRQTHTFTLPPSVAEAHVLRVEQQTSEADCGKGYTSRRK